MRGKSHTIGGTQHRVWCWNNTPGVPIVALHGFTGTGRDFAPLAERLDRPFFAPDLLGHGQTDAPEQAAPYAMQTVVAGLEVLLRTTLPEGPFVLMGYSMGGRTALHLAPRVMNRLAGLILIGTHPGLRGVTERLQRAQADHALAERIESRGIAWFQPYWAAMPIIATQENIEGGAQEKMRSYRAKNQPHGLANSLRGMGLGAMAPTWDRLTRLTVPTTVIVGEDDTRYRPLGAALARALPAARLEIIGGAGHCAHLEQPTSVIPWVETGAG
jgi:2-succinyl-6-hydroxy-2,4-cyclohexadiene-1-carboxylate synthase